MASARHNLTSKWWATFNQWKDLGRQGHAPTRRRARGPVGHDRSSSGRPSPRPRRTPRATRRRIASSSCGSYTVFNVDQVEGGHLDHLRAGQADTGGDDASSTTSPPRTAIAATGITIRTAAAGRSIRPSEDFVQVPPKASFTEPDEYYETVFHELVHATEHPSRLNWCRKEKENTYALGELVAEIGACYLARELGVPGLGEPDESRRLPGELAQGDEGRPPFHLHGLVPRLRRPPTTSCPSAARPPTSPSPRRPWRSDRTLGAAGRTPP